MSDGGILGALFLSYSREQQAAMAARIQLGEFPEFGIVCQHFGGSTVYHASPNSSVEMLCGVHAGGDDAAWTYDDNHRKASVYVWCEGCLRSALTLRLEPVWTNATTSR